MAKILHSKKFVQFMINQKNKINYLKNGGGYMANAKIFKEETTNFFDGLVEFLKEQEQKEKSENQETTKLQEDKKETTTSFGKDFLEQELDDALNTFNLSYASKLKQKLNELSTCKEFPKNEEEFITNFSNLKNKTEDEVTKFLSDGIKNEEFSKHLIKFLTGIIKND